MKQTISMQRQWLIVHLTIIYWNSFPYPSVCISDIRLPHPCATKKKKSEGPEGKDEHSIIV